MEIKWMGHASFEIKVNGKIIYIDPYFGEYTDKADIILISHGHYDHSSAEKVKDARVDSTIILTTKEVTPHLDGTIMNAGDKKEIGNIKIEAVPAYNIGKDFHPKGTGLGFIIEADNKKVYFAGDTDLIPEMKEIKADVVLLPVGGTYTMNAKEAAEAVLTIRPNIAIPMHFGSGIVGTIDDAELFKEKVEEKSHIHVKILKHGETIKL